MQRALYICWTFHTAATADYTRCVGNKWFQLSNFPSLSQLSLSSTVALCARAHLHIRIYACAALYANNECAGWDSLRARARERDANCETTGRLLAQASPLKLKGRGSSCARRAVFPLAKIKTRLHRLNTIRPNKQLLFSLPPLSFSLFPSSVVN